ncbi:MAG: HlyD family efflux transporter periplasmic adaptor subunit [Cellulosilyticaceae bacterium]
MKKTDQKKSKQITKSQPTSYTDYRKKAPSSNTYNLEEYRRTKQTTGKQAGGQQSSSKKNASKKTASKQPKTQSTYKSAYQNPYTTRYQAPSQPAKSQQKSAEERRADIKKKNKLTRAEMQRLKERRRKAYRLRLFGLAVMSLFCVYAGIKVVQTLNYPKISYQTVQMGVIDNSKKLEGIAVRDEKVYMSKESGNLHYLVGEGQKVAKNKEVCMIAEDAAVESLGTQLDDIDRSLYNIQEKRENLSTYQPELHNLNTAVSQEMKQYYNQLGNSGADRIYVLRKELNHIIQTRTDIYVQDETVRTEAIQANRQDVSQNLEGKKKMTFAEDAGIVSYNMDGLEAELSLGKLAEMDYVAFKKLLQESKKGDGMKTTLHAVAKEPLFKVVTKDEWAVVAYVNLDEAVQYEVGKKYDLIFPELGNQHVMFTLEGKEEQESRVRLVFKTRDQINKFLGERVVNFTVGETRAEGLKIPLQAILEKNLFPIPEKYLTEKDHKKGVMRVKGELMEFIPVSVQYYNEEKAYVLQEMNKTGALMIGDVIKLAEGAEKVTLKEVVTETGVYTVNGRFAQFKPIEVIMVNDESAIVSKGGKTKLKEFDQIISNPKSINQDQLLRAMNVQNE